MSGHQPIEQKHRDLMNKVGEVLNEMFAGHGFCLLVFPMSGDKGRMNYISNADRKDMIVAMKEFIGRNEGRVAPEPEMKQ